MAKRPWMTSTDLINAVKRKISLPMSQQTFSEDDILAFANEELLISQVPSVMQYHQEYFAYKVLTPLVSNISRYSIPDRAIGMKLRDVMWSDTNGNFLEMERVSPEDKAFFQNGDNSTAHKYYLEGTDIVLAPTISEQATGNLNFFIYLRPNQLVATNRAAIIRNFNKDFTITNASLTVGDKLTITNGNNSNSVVTNEFTLSNNSVTSSSVGNPATITVASPHGKAVSSTFRVVITEHTGSIPAISGTYTATATGANTFTIPVNVSTGGSGGKVAYGSEFSLGSTGIQTAANLATAINNAFAITTTNNNTTNVVEYNYNDISTTFSTSLTNEDAIAYEEEFIHIDFDQVPTTWTDPVTNLSETLYENGALVDFLQTKPGHKTHAYDIELVEVSGTQCKFRTTDLQSYLSNSSGGMLKTIQILVGDYMCLANECIIPQIPPDLHSGLAERTCARILASLGDQAGLQMSQAKIAEIVQSEGSLLDNRVEGSPIKLVNRYSLLSAFKRRY